MGQISLGIDFIKCISIKGEIKDNTDYQQDEKQPT